MTAMTISIYTARPRHEAIDAVKSAVTVAGGWISGHALYSNKAAAIQAVVERQDLRTFLECLAADQLATPESAVYQSLMTLHKDGDSREVSVACAMTFVHDEPDLKLEVPAVPG